MEFRCERDQLLEAVQFASRAISSRATLPVLSGLRIDAIEEGLVTITATDLELTMQASFEAGVDDPGRVIVPGRLFGEMAKSLPPGQVVLNVFKDEVAIKAGRGHFHVKALDVDNYPNLPIDNEAGEQFEAAFEPAQLAAAMAQIICSASTDESRQSLTGVLWDFDSDALTLVSTDSYRLGIKKLSFKGTSSEPCKVVLPARALSELARALPGILDQVTASFQQNQVAFWVGEGGRKVVASRFIEGEFPNYRQLVPEGYPNALTVNRKELLEVTTRVALLAQGNLPVKLRLDRELEVSAHTPDVGEGQEVLEAEYQGEEFEIAFNPKFFSDGLNAVQGDRAVLTAGDGLKPVLLREEDDASYTYLLMPVRLS